MGYVLGVETDNQKECPIRFISTNLAGLLYEFHLDGSRHPLGVLGKHFALDLTPLKNIAIPDYTLEAYLATCATREEAEYWFNRTSQQNQAAWQSPKTFIDCKVC